MRADEQMTLKEVPSTQDKADRRNRQTTTTKSRPRKRAPREDLFTDQFEFVDDVHGQVTLNRLERDVVDSPEFQRLFRLSQLGFVDLVYPTANHSRAVHSIGASFISKRLVDRLNQNNAALISKKYVDTLPTISHAERVLISLGGLLHDVSHGPFSHDIEKKTHHVFLHKRSRPIKVRSHYGPYEKHDSFLVNPALYVTIMDPERSLLARILREYSPNFYRLLLDDGERHEHLTEFIRLLDEVNWPNVEEEILPALLFNLLVFEKPEDADNGSLRLLTSFDATSPTQVGLGPDSSSWKALHDAWYQPFRHDIIGDTLSADLIDYLMRDQARLGIKGGLDDKLLNFYVLVPWSPTDELQKFASMPRWHRTAIDLVDHKRGTFRSERLSDIFRLLDLRHQIHEKAVYHRVVQSAIAMLARACLVLGDNKPSLKTLYGYDAESPALAGDDHFLEILIKTGVEHENVQKQPFGPNAEVHRTLIHKLAERRVYRPLMVVPGDRVPVLLRLSADESREMLELVLRQLAAILDSTFFAPLFLITSKLIELLLQHALESEDAVYDELEKLLNDEDVLTGAARSIPKRVIFWTTPYKQLYKDPAIQVRVHDGLTTTLDRLQDDDTISDSLRSRIAAGIGDAETKNEALWKFYVFISDSLFYTGVLAKVLPNHPCHQNPDNHAEHLQTAKRLVVKAVTTAWEFWKAKDRKVDLNKPASIQELKDLIELFQSDRIYDRISQSYSNIPDEVSAVQISQYLHGDDSPKCRDVRYKFDAPGDLEQALNAVSEGDQELLKVAFESLGLSKDALGQEELVEVLTKLHRNADRLSDLTQKTAARNRPFDDTVLRSFWNDLS